MNSFYFLQWITKPGTYFNALPHRWRSYDLVFSYHLVPQQVLESTSIELHLQQGTYIQQETYIQDALPTELPRQIFIVSEVK